MTTSNEQMPCTKQAKDMCLLYQEYVEKQSLKKASRITIKDFLKMRQPDMPNQHRCALGHIATRLMYKYDLQRIRRQSSFLYVDGVVYRQGAGLLYPRAVLNEAYALLRDSGWTAKL